MKKTAMKGMSVLFVLFVVAAFATGVQAQDAADNEKPPQPTLLLEQVWH